MTTIFVDYVMTGNTTMDFGRMFMDVAALRPVTTDMETGLQPIGGNTTRGAMVTASETSNSYTRLTQTLWLSIIYA